MVDLFPAPAGTGFWQVGARFHLPPDLWLDRFRSVGGSYDPRSPFFRHTLSAWSASLLWGHCLAVGCSGRTHPNSDVRRFRTTLSPVQSFGDRDLFYLFPGFGNGNHTWTRRYVEKRSSPPPTLSSGGNPSLPLGTWNRRAPLALWNRSRSGADHYPVGLALLRAPPVADSHGLGPGFSTSTDADRSGCHQPASGDPCLGTSSHPWRMGHQ